MIRSRIVSLLMLTVLAVEQPVRAHEQRSSAAQRSSEMVTEARAGVPTPPYPLTYQHHVADGGFQLRPALEQQLSQLYLAARSAPQSRASTAFSRYGSCRFSKDMYTSLSVTTVTVTGTPNVVHQK
jgi:hypothetical protein